MAEQMREGSDSDDSLRQRADIVSRLLGEVYGIKPWKPRRQCVGWTAWPMRSKTIESMRGSVAIDLFRYFSVYWL